MFRVKLSNQAEKFLKKSDKISQKKAAKSLILLATNPFLGEKMEGEFQGSYRIKIPPLRIIYTPDFGSKTIWVRAIGHRGEVYK
ncbi:MAG: type II toxin-antitoxin system RelE/ParE family toxin [Candidatus Omnitrophota bacterium]